MPAMMGNPKNHSQLLTDEQMEAMRKDYGIPEGEDFPMFEPGSKEAELLARVSRQISRQEIVNETGIERNRKHARAELPENFPERFALDEGTGRIPTQLALNSMIGKLSKIADTKPEDLSPEDRVWKPFADGLVVISPDVMS